MPERKRLLRSGLIALLLGLWAAAALAAAAAACSGAVSGEGVASAGDTASSERVAPSWETETGEALPGKLLSDLRDIAVGGGSPEWILSRGALALLEAGWLADSLRLSAGVIEARGLRRHHCHIAHVEGLDWDPPWRAGMPMDDAATLRQDAEEWLWAMDRRGHPFSQIWLRPRAEEAGDSLLIEAVFLPGPSGPAGELRITGLDRLDEGFLAAYLDLETESPLSLARARRGRDRLSATGWFLSVEEPLLGWDSVTGRVGLLYAVAERPRPNRVSAMLGGGSGETSGAVDIDLFSPFGAGRRWRLGTDWLGRQHSRLHVALTEPRVFSSMLALDLEFNRVRQDSTFLQQSVQLDLRFLLPAGWEGIAGAGYERSLFELNQTEMSRRRHRFGLAWQSLGPGPPGERRLRLITDLLIKRSSLPGEVEEENQWEGRGNWLWTQRLRPPWKLRTRGGASLLVAGADGGFNEAELFPLGGTNSLRGHDEEHFRGDRVAHASLELVLGEPLELSLFLDYGWGRWLRLGQPQVSFEGWGAGFALKAPGSRGGLSLALALGGERSQDGGRIFPELAKIMENLRIHLALDTGF